MRIGVYKMSSLLIAIKEKEIRYKSDIFSLKKIHNGNIKILYHSVAMNNQYKFIFRNILKITKYIWYLRKEETLKKPSVSSG